MNPNPAVIHPSGELSHAELERAVGRVAGALVAARLKRGELLAFFPRGELTDLLLIHAAPRAGVALFPLDPRQPRERFRRLLRDSGAEWVLTSGAFELDGVRLFDPQALNGDAPPPPAERRLADHEPQLLIATSGSSGAPKGVMLSGANLAAAVAASAERTPLVDGDRWLCCLPLFHVGGISIPLRCHAAGATLVLHDHFDEEWVLTDLARFGVTHLSLVPTQLHRLLELAGDRPLPDALRAVLVGGAPLTSELALRAHRAGWPIRPSYGMSETASQVATLERLDEGWRPGRVGRPLKGFEVRCEDEGRLMLRGEAVMLGYANPSRTPGDGLRDGWFISGDRGRLETDGSLTLLGRVDRLIVSGGEKIDPWAVEARLMEHPAVERAAAVGLPDLEWGERLVALVVGEVEADELTRWCRRRLDGPWRPKAFLSVTSLPGTALDKTDYVACREMALAHYKKGGNFT